MATNNAQKSTPKSKITKAGADVRKPDTKALVVNAVDGAPDDVFSGSYWVGTDKDNVLKPAIIEPTYKPGQLHTLTVQNNTLAQCIEVMEVNIDGTGHSIDLIKDANEDETEKTTLTDFFAEPYPGKSMIAIRRACRRDLESTGCGYLEVIRNPLDEIVLMNHCDAITTRLIRYDDPVQVTHTMMRGGKEIPVSMMARERRFVQSINGKKVYFKQFGASRDLDRNTGEWAKEGQRLPADKRATEIIYMIGNREPKTPYGTPRWINQMPSVLGSRKAEELNLEFFDAGGLPPVLVVIQGGTIGTLVREELQAHLNGKGGGHRAAIVEATSTSGSLDSAGSVQVKVERFGAERQQDAMFQSYDKSTEEHVRAAFRIPPLFTGKAGDYSFATAYASYLVAEAQVFWPEREEFDDVINHTVVKALGVKNYKFRSLPLSLVDITNQLKALEMVAGKFVDGQELVDKLNEVVGLGLEYTEQKAPEPPKGKIDPLTSLPYTQPEPPPSAPVAPVAANQAGVGTGTGPIKKSEEDLNALVEGWLGVLGLQEMEVDMTPEDVSRVAKAVKALGGEEAHRFNTLIAERTIAKFDLDTSGLGTLCGCAAQLGSEHGH